MSSTSERLFTPGPVEIPARVLAALGKRPPHHRSAAFRELLAGLHSRLSRLYGTSGRVVLFAASGTGGLEAAALGLARPGEDQLVAAAGKFGERWDKILRAYGHEPRVVRAELGKPVPPEAIEEALAARPAHTVFLTHSETSTGTLHDLRAQAAAARRHGALVVTDVVTSLAVHAFRQDEFGVDVAVAGSQKGLMLPPGLALVGLSERALARLAQDEPRRSPSFYFDLRRAAERAAEADTPFTPAISLIQALDESLRMIEELGLEAVWRRHAQLAAAVRAGAAALGATLFSAAPADSVTALVPPAGVPPPRVVEYCRERHGLLLAGGQDALKGKIVRVGHMGLAYAPEDAYVVTEALAGAFADAGAAVSLDGARAAVARVLKESPCESSSPTP